MTVALNRLMCLVGFLAIMVIANALGLSTASQAHTPSLTASHPTVSGISLDHLMTSPELGIVSKPVDTAEGEQKRPCQSQMPPLKQDHECDHIALVKVHQASTHASTSKTLLPQLRSEVWVMPRLLVLARAPPPDQVTRSAPFWRVYAATSSMRN